jgi:hypothetical protein
MSEDDEQKEDFKLVSRHAEQLGEHFDSVQIFVTGSHADGDGTTRCITRGSGNWYASYGAILEWVIAQDQRTRNNLGFKTTEEEG